MNPARQLLELSVDEIEVLAPTFPHSGFSAPSRPVPSTHVRPGTMVGPESHACCRSIDFFLLSEHLNSTSSACSKVNT